MPVFRTFPLEEAQRQRMSEARESSGKTTAAFLRDAIDANLPDIIAELEAIGIPLLNGGTRPARLPLDDQLIAALNLGAKATGIPTTRLLAACLQRACEQSIADRS